MLSREQLKELGEEGFIAGPDESEEEFVKRVDKLRLLAKDPERLLKGMKLETWEAEKEPIFGAHPQWIPWTYSNHKLPPWQGAVMWLFEGEGKERLPIIQLREGFKKGKYLFYKREEVLWHEALHAMRMRFDEPRFEELLAYYHSKSKIRKFFGPLFRKPSQAIIFVLLILLSIAFQMGSLFFITSPIFPLMKGLALLPVLDLAFRTASLIKDQRLLKKTLKKLSKIFRNQKDVFPIAIRLNDAEIQSFAIQSVEQILNTIEDKIPYSLRWRQILAQFC